MPYAASNRALARALGVSEKAVRKAEQAGRIQRAADLGFDVEACRKSWAGKSEPTRSRVRTKVRTSTRGPHPTGSAAAAVRTHDEARQALALIAQVLADEGIVIADGETVDFAAARLAETILKARQRELMIAEKRRKLVPLTAVTDHVAKAFVGFRQIVQRMPARHAAAMAAELQCDPAGLHSALDRMIANTRTEMSAPVLRG